MGRFFPYLGGKTKMISELVKYIPSHRTFVEVFGGSAEFLFSKHPSFQEVYNDINGDLVNLFMQMRDNVEAVSKRLEYLPNSREIYEKWSKDFRNGLAPSDPIEKAARFYYILCCQFAGKMYGGWAYGLNTKHWSYSTRVNKLPTISKRLEQVIVECSDFRKTIQVWDSEQTFFYLDPPYYEQSGYRVGFSEQDHRDLAELLKNIRGKWLLTYNDHALIRDLYDGFLVDAMEVQLSSEKMDQDEKRKSFTNLIIRNYDQTDPTQSILGSYIYPEILEEV